MKASLAKLGARVTAESPEATYLSLRNTHADIRELGATIEVDLRSRKDLTDFSSVNQAVAASLGQPHELEDFNKWLRSSLGAKAAPVLHNEYSDFKVTLTRKPLRSVFTARAAAMPE